MVQRLENLENSRGGPQNYGLVKILDSSSVTELEGAALGAREKNAALEGTIANQISKITTALEHIGDSYSVGVGGAVSGGEGNLSGSISIPAGTYVITAALGLVSESSLELIGISVNGGMSFIMYNSKQTVGILKISTSAVCCVRIKPAGGGTVSTTNDGRFNYLQAVRIK